MAPVDDDLDGGCAVVTMGSCRGRGPFQEVPGGSRARARFVFSTKADGTGLGLPIARQIAAAHGGSLAIESVAGNGMRVEVRLPLAAAPL
jgi:signal transduction histidine kinase